MRNLSSHHTGKPEAMAPGAYTVTQGVCSHICMQGPAGGLQQSITLQPIDIDIDITLSTCHMAYHQNGLIVLDRSEETRLDSGGQRCLHLAHPCNVIKYLGVDYLGCLMRTQQFC